jgi:hypothetical protein
VLSITALHPQRCYLYIAWAVVAHAIRWKTLEAIMWKILIVTVSAVALLATSQHAFARDENPTKRHASLATKLRAGLDALKNDTNKFLKHGNKSGGNGALGFGGTAAPNVRCPPGAVC